MGQIPLFWPYSLYEGNSLGNCEMGDVPLPAKCIHNKILNPCKLLFFGFRYVIPIGQVCEFTDSEAQDRKAEMQHSDRNDLHRTNNKRLGGNRMCDYLGNARIFLLCKYVGETVIQGSQDPFFGKDIHGTVLNEIERPDIVQSGCMIPVLVGKQDRIQPGYTGSKHLLPEIRPGVYDHHLVILFHQDGGAQSLVLCILRQTTSAPATDNGYTLRGASSQKSNSQLD